MDSDNLVFRTVFVDRDVDAAVLAYAERLQAKRGALFRLFLEAGLAHLARGGALPAARAETAVIRTALLPIAVDERLEGLAWRLRIDKVDLIRALARHGMLAMQATLESQPSPTLTASEPVPSRVKTLWKE